MPDWDEAYWTDMERMLVVQGAFIEVDRSHTAGRFNDETHLLNFSKMILSLSARRPETEQTALNSITTFDEDGDIETVQPRDTDVAKQVIEANVLPYAGQISELRSDRSKMLFIWESEIDPGLWISNFIAGPKPDGSFEILDRDVFEEFSEGYFGSDEETFAFLRKNISDEGDRIIAYWDASEEDRFDLNRDLHEEVSTYRAYRDPHIEDVGFPIISVTCVDYTWKGSNFEIVRIFTPTQRLENKLAR